MTHPNRILHRKDVEAGVIDNNPYPADLKPAQLETGNAIDHLTTGIFNEQQSSDPIFATERSLKYPTFSLHGKAGNLNIDKDGTYQLNGCTIQSLNYETPATIILRNSSIAAIQGKMKNQSPDAKIRFIFIDSTLENIKDSEHFFISLNGLSSWNGNMSKCRFGAVTMLQTKDWITEHSVLDCEHITMSFSMGPHAKVLPVGTFFAKNSKHCRFQFHGTDLTMNNSQAILFNNCSHILSQHHGAKINAGATVAKSANQVAITLHSSNLEVDKWLFKDLQGPVLSAINSTIKVNSSADSGIMSGCDDSKVYIGHNTQCSASNVLSGKNGVLQVQHASIKATQSIIDGTDCKVELHNANLEASGSDTAIILSNNSSLLSYNSDVKSQKVAYTITESIVRIDGGKVQGDTNALNLTKCSSALSMVNTTSSDTDILLNQGSLNIEGGSLSQSLTASKTSSLTMSGVNVGKNISVADGANTTLQGNTVGGDLTISGGHYQGSGNIFSGKGSVSAAMGTIGKDKFGKALSLKGVHMLSEVNAANVSNTGFMLLEGGSGSSSLAKTKRGWHVTGSMDWVIDKDLFMNVGKNLDYRIAQNANYKVGKNLSYKTGKTETHNAGTQIALKAPKITEN